MIYFKVEILVNIIIDNYIVKLGLVDQPSVVVTLDPYTIRGHSKEAIY